MAATPLGLVARAWAGHQGLLKSSPYAANAGTSGVLMLAGDRLAGGGGARGGGPPAASWRRTGVLTAWSVAAASPFWTWWYRLLPRVLPGRVAAWIALTAVAVAPPVNGFFLAYVT